MTFFISTIQVDNERETVPANRRNLAATEKELRKITPANFQRSKHSEWNAGDTDAASMPEANILKVTIRFIVIIF